jgi:hypothetical protein
MEFLMSQDYFVFTSRLDQYVYDRLCGDHREEIGEIMLFGDLSVKTETIKLANDPRLDEDGKWNVIEPEIASRLGELIREWMDKNAPLGASGDGDQIRYADDVYGDLLSHAMEQVDYECIAAAFLQGVPNDQKYEAATV